MQKDWVLEMNLKKGKVVVIKKEKRRNLKPHTLGNRNIKDLAREMHLYVQHLKKKGIKVVRIK